MSIYIYIYIYICLLAPPLAPSSLPNSENPSSRLEDWTLWVPAEKKLPLCFHAPHSLAKQGDFRAETYSINSNNSYSINTNNSYSNNTNNSYSINNNNTLREREAAEGEASFSLVAGARDPASARKREATISIISIIITIYVYYYHYLYY